MKDFSVKAGEDFVLPVLFVGTPVPSVMWSYNGSKVSPSHRLTIETGNGLTSIHIANVQRCDAGTYELKLSNYAGSAKASYMIFVQGL